jgi:hypothetical protein
VMLDLEGISKVYQLAISMRFEVGLRVAHKLQGHYSSRTTILTDLIFNFVLTT